MPSETILPRGTSESQGISSDSILAFVNAAETKLKEPHSLMLLRHGVVVAEGWWSPYSPKRLHMLFSLSKSFTSTAVGLAIAEKRLSIDDRVLSFFPEEAPAHISKKLDMMRVRHLLSMSTGHAEDTIASLYKRRDGNWIKAFLAQPVKYTPGTHFLYNTGATYMLSAIIQKVTGLTLLAYLQPRLLDPLGIEGATWQLSPQGINTGGFGLSVKTEDIARFGQLYLQKGVWDTRQLVPGGWIDQATSRQISNGSNPESDWAQGYGFQFWLCRYGAYRGDGAFGQFCVVIPEQDAVLAMTSGVPDMQAELNLVWEYLLPAMRTISPIPDNVKAQEKLARKLHSLAFSPPSGQVTSTVAARVSGKHYVLDPNPMKAKSITFDFSESGCTVTLRNPKGSHRIVCGNGIWREGLTDLFDGSPCVAVSGVWSDENTFLITVRRHETAFVHSLACHFASDQIAIDGTVNVSFGPTTYSLAGKMDQ